jgi:hypothetical protein
MPGRVSSFLIFAVLVAAMLYDTILGIRLLGLAEMGCGSSGKIPYGWRGMPASGYLTGWAAVGVGVLAIALGAVFTVVPKLVEPFFRVHR